jgi:formylglycine-generating enzyme required for sulfatase activity
MTRKSARPAAAKPPRPADPRRRWLLTAAVVGLLALGAFVLGYALVPPDEPGGEMVLIKGGTFWMGRDPATCDSPLCSLPGVKDAEPTHEVELDDFWIDAAPVTNAEFERFVKTTGYRTYAEQPTDGLPPGSFVFTAPESVESLKDHMQWWRYVEGADWRHPEGPGSDIAGREDHPVVQVCWHDALAYAKWAGKRLPTEAEFEYAARGGLDRKRYVWGDEMKPGGRWPGNIWQGKFPTQNSEEDGHRATSPVKSYPANGYGLYDTAGNVWQWCSDWYRPDWYENSPRKNPQGPAESFDPGEPGVPKRVQRGGSFLCNDVYCQGYQPGSRHKSQPTSAANHIGFRCARSAK